MTKNQITQKASRLGIKKNNPIFKPFTDKELKLIKNNYNKMTIKELIKKYLPGRTESSIMSKANRMGLNSREKWSIDECELLRKVYPNKVNEDIVAEYFPNRTIPAIQSQAEKLGLEKYQCRREYSEDYLLKKLREFAFDLGRTPSGDDILAHDTMPSLMTYHRYFGSYKSACEMAGLEINHPRLFGKESFYFSSNGDICLSKAELTITEALIDNNIEYIKEAYYSDILKDKRCGSKRCDWLINKSIIVEYFGMPEIESYKNKMNLKIKICNDNNVTLIPLYRKDLTNIHNIIQKIKTLTSENRND